jgi:hypothetical protein
METEPETYIHLEENGVDELLTVITARMNEGYTPYGGLLVHERFGQTMILKKADCVQKMVWAELVAIGAKVPASR